MIDSLRRHWIPIVLFALVPISSCTLISEVDRGLIDDGPPDARGTGGSAGSGGASGTNGASGTGGTGGADDGPRSNDATNDVTDDAADDASGDSSGD